MGKWPVMKYVSFLILLITQSVYAAWELRGHQRLIGTAIFGAEGEFENRAFYKQAVANTRLIGLYKGDKLSAEVAYEIFASYSRYEDSLLQQGIEDSSFRYRLDDLDYLLAKHKMNEPDSYMAIQNLDRLSLTYENEKNRIRVGRQVVAFGSARTVNPLDILVPFNLVMINLEQKTGVDAIRLTHATGALGELEIGEVFSKDTTQDDQFKFITYADSISSWDYKLHLFSMEETLVKGLDLQGPIGNIGTWLEYGSFELKNLASRERYSLGGQYLFSSELNIFIEYHYNGFFGNGSISLRDKFGVFLRDRHYVNLGGNYAITPLFGVNFIVYNNIDDGSHLLAPSFEYNYSPEWYWELGGFLGVGEESSEFQSYHRALYTTLKTYF